MGGSLAPSREQRAVPATCLSLSSVVTLPAAYRTVQCVLDQSCQAGASGSQRRDGGHTDRGSWPYLQHIPGRDWRLSWHWISRGTLDEVTIETAGLSLAQCPIDGLEYIATYPDLFRALGADAAAGQAHYLNQDRRKVANPTDLIRVQYVRTMPDLQAAFGSDTQSALTHYIQYGFAEGRTDQPNDAHRLQLVPSQPVRSIGLANLSF